MMGQRTGFEVIELIRLAGHELPAILLTGRGDEEIAVKALHAGAADYIPKTALSSQTLERSLGNAIEKARLRGALEEYRVNLERTVKDLRKRNDEIRTFYHTLSHEIKTPLASAREFISIVLDGLGGPLTAEQEDYLGTAKRSCDQLVACMNDILDVVRMETGKLSLQMEPADIVELVEHAVTCTRSAAKEAGLVLETSFDADLPQVQADSVRVHQVLTNLLGNAIKFTDTGGSIRIRVRHESESQDFVTVSVEDTGRGMQPEERERVFERLYQVREEDAAITGGLGLGLNIASELVRYHGGEIRVESEPGVGSTFSFTLQVCAESETANP